MKQTVLSRFAGAVAIALLPFLMLHPAAAGATNDGSASTDESPHFAKAIDDLPLMPGLELVEDEDVLFAAPGAGRIAETNAMGPVDADDVYKFYHRSLPHLGWKAVDSRTYRRDNEELRIDATANQKVTVVKFTVKPIGSH